MLEKRLPYLLVMVVSLSLLTFNWVQRAQFGTLDGTMTAMEKVPSANEMLLDQVMMISNALIAIAYASIPVSLVVFIVKRRDIPFSWVFVLFGAFILACGTTHAMHVITIWKRWPMNWLQAAADILTAFISVFSAVIIWPLLPKILAFPSPAQLRAVNLELQTEKKHLQQAQSDLRSAYAEVEQRVAERTSELVSANQTLQKEIIKRQQAQEAHAQSEQRYRSLFNGMTEGFALHELVFDQNGQPCDYRFLDINPAFERLTGLQRESVIGRLQSQVVPGEDPLWLQTYSKVALTGESIQLENFSVVLQKYFDVLAYRPAAHQFAVIVKDITARKEAEAEREQLLVELERKNRDLESMVYIASHDLRSPLVNIQGFSASLRKYAGQIEHILQEEKSLEEIRIELKPILTERFPRALSFIGTSSTKMDSLINGLLRLSRVGRAQIQPETLDMDALFQSILDTAAFQIEKVGAYIDLRSPLAPCTGDRQQINQVFSNLVDNAIKYRDPARPLTISIFCRQEGKNVIYSVEDNGVGISPENLDKIWELFRRIETNETVTGEGLGLTIARRIVERHNGKIWVESQLHAGSRFNVQLPAANGKSL
jgi:PAS domain S-box-containing protein